MCGKAAKICLTGKQHLELNKIKGFTVCSRRLIQRATIILLAFEGMLNVQISLLVGIGRHQVGLWRRRWQQSFEALVAIEQNETHAQFRRTVEDAMRPGQPERIEFEYKRHGTLCLIGNWDVVLGKMIAPTIGRTRTEFDFAWHIHDTIATDPEARWRNIYWF